MRYSINLNVTLQEDFLNREVSTVGGCMQDGVFINFRAAPLLSVSVAPRAQQQSEKSFWLDKPGQIF